MSQFSTYSTSVPISTQKVRAKRSEHMQATNFCSKIFCCTITVGWQKFVQYIRMLYLGCLILVGSVLALRCACCKPEDGASVAVHFSKSTYFVYCLGRPHCYERHLWNIISISLECLQSGKRMARHLLIIYWNFDFVRFYCITKFSVVFRRLKNLELRQ